MRQWQNLDIELYDHDTVGRVESVKVRVARSPAGVQREAQSVEIPSTLRTAADALAKDQLDLKQTIEFGAQLAAVLLPEPAAELFANSRAQLPDDAGLRIRVEVRSLALADLPWEYAYWRPDNADDSEPQRGFLVLNRQLSLVRYEPVAEPPGTCAPLGGKPVEVAMLLANPQIPGWATLDLDSEVKAVESGLSDEPDVQLSVHRNATTRGLNDVLDARPHVFHFSGHGQFRLVPSEKFGGYVGRGELLFEDETGGADAVSAQELAGKMRGSGVRLAVLNSCDSARRDNLNAFTGIAPTLVRDGVPAVLAMQYPIRDARALSLARRLYHNLADHQSIDAAVTSARLAMFDADAGYDRDWGVPVLYLRSDQAVLFPDPSAATVPAYRRLGKYGLANVVLAAVLVFALAYLYLRHLEPRLPLGTLVGGILAAAVLASVTFVTTIAGDSLRGAILGWLRRRRATLVLAAALATTGVAVAFAPPPVALRIVAGKSLLSLIAPEEIDNPVRKYQLVIQADRRDAVSMDFRQHGVTIAESPALAARLSQRYESKVETDMRAYLGKHSLSNLESKHLSKWRLAGTPHSVPGFGRAGAMQVRLEESGAIVSCVAVDVANLNDDMTTLFLEKGDACN